MGQRRRRYYKRQGFLSKIKKPLFTVIILCCIIFALTLFFRVDKVVITGVQRYSDGDVLNAMTLKKGDNLILFNKYRLKAQILRKLPYIEKVRINRNLPDTLLIEAWECKQLLAFPQGDGAWLVSASGKIVDWISEEEIENYGVISGCKLAKPSVGTELILDTDLELQQESLLSLMQALGEAGMIGKVTKIQLDDPSYISMRYAERFTVKLLYGADYTYKLKILLLYLDSEKIQDNMTGSFDMTKDDRNYFQQDKPE